MSETTKYRCDNCGSTDAPDIPMEEIPDLAQRLDVGGVVPAGQCACGALTYWVGGPRPELEAKMKTNRLYELEKLINAHLSSLPPARRPELSTRRRAQSVAVIARGFEAQDSSGNTECVTIAEGLRWLSLEAK